MSVTLQLSLCELDLLELVAIILTNLVLLLQELAHGFCWGRVLARGNVLIVSFSWC